MNKIFSILSILSIIYGLTILISSCNYEDNPKPIMRATSIELVTGENQSAMAESVLENPIEVIVKDQKGNAFEGAIVNFTVVEGFVSETDVTTDINGKAKIYWTLGLTAGTQSLIISGVGTPFSVTATAIYKPIIGDFYQGGVIFYIDETKLHGYVCAVNDQSIGAEWGCNTVEIVGADETSVNSGAQNTIDIEACCVTEGTAADVCTKLTLNTYNDWFLPSKDELYIMYENKTIIDATAIANGGIAFAPDFYWSSSECNSYRAWRQSFDIGVQYQGHKGYPDYVRAVRAF